MRTLAHLERDSAKHGVALTVGELDVRRADRQRPLPQTGSRRRLDDLDREVEHREDLAPSGDGGLGFAVHLGEVGKHVEEHVGQKQERTHPSERESPPKAERGAEHDDQRERRRVEDR